LLTHSYNPLRGIDRRTAQDLAHELYAASRCEYEDDQHTTYANLLASALDPESEIEKKFMSVLAELSSRDVKVLRSMFAEWLYYEGTLEKKMGETRYSSGVFGTNESAVVQPIISQFSAIGTGEPAQTECHDRAAVLIEPVAADSLSKTGIFAKTAGDFRRFPPQVRQGGSPETKSNARKAGISGLFLGLLGSLAKRRTGWLGREGSNLRIRPDCQQYQRTF